MTPDWGRINEEVGGAWDRELERSVEEHFGEEGEGDPPDDGPDEPDESDECPEYYDGR